MLDVVLSSWILQWAIQHYLSFPFFDFKHNMDIDYNIYFIFKANWGPVDLFYILSH